MSKQTSSSGSIGIMGLLGVLFVGLKLTGYIDWSWWWVTAPFWGGIVLALMIITIAFLITVVVDTWERR